MKQLTTILLVCFLFFSVSNIMAQYKIPDQPVDKPFPWPEGKRCAISLTFDDARFSQIDAGIPLLNKHEVKATFYISPGSFLKRKDGWIAAAKSGHEIGNHTMTHPCTGNYAFSRRNALEDYTLGKIAQEMDRANQFIYEHLKINPVSFAYPCGQKFVGRNQDQKSYAPLVSKKFLTGRGWLGESSNDPWFCDFSHLEGMESDGKSFEELKKLVDNAAKEGRWLVLAGHEIGQKGNQTTLIPELEKLCQYAKNPANGIWIDTVAAIGQYVMETRK
jgi:peptidoglycan-N-acetylglucosamine deacetylase